MYNVVVESNPPLRSTTAFLSRIVASLQYKARDYYVYYIEFFSSFN